MISSILSDASPSCRNCRFAPFCWHEEKQPRSKQSSRAAKRQRHLKRKEILCLPNHKFQNLYVVQSGALKAYQVDANGKELIRDFYFAGEVLGYEAIYTGHYLFSAVALSDTLICEIPYDSFLELIYSKPPLQKRILYLISQQLNVGSYLDSVTLEQRLAAFLIDLSTRLHPLEMQTEFTLPMSRQDIGSYLRLTAETVSRIFSRLHKNKIIAIDNKKIRFLELDKLKKIASGE